MGLSGLWWWIDRWRKSTAYMDMTLEQQGAYRNLLDEAHLRGGALPNDERVLAKACGDARAWRRLKPVVMARFTLQVDGWHNQTLDEVLSDSVRRAEKQKRYRQGKNGPLVQAILERDGAVCGICACQVSVESAEIDHIIPISSGGHPDDVRNLQLSHPICNHKKGARGPQRHHSLPPLSGITRSNTQSNFRITVGDLSESETDKSSGNGSEKRKEDERFLAADDVKERAARFTERYAELFREHRRGARYLGKPTLDYQEAITLCANWDSERLEKLAIAFLTTDDKFCRQGSGSIAQFRSRASWCDAKLREAGL
jgi:uncharacterized protein YdaU (DUF1376 family)